MRCFTSSAIGVVKIKLANPQNMAVNRLDISKWYNQLFSLDGYQKYKQTSGNIESIVTYSGFKKRNITSGYENEIIFLR